MNFFLDLPGARFFFSRVFPGPPPRPRPRPQRLFEGVCVNYRHPDPRRGEPRVGSALDVAFPVDPLDPLDPLDPVQNSVRLKNLLFLHAFGHFWPELRTSLCTKYVQISFFHKKSEIHRFFIVFFFFFGEIPESRAYAQPWT